jgi:hypothetical protein
MQFNWRAHGKKAESPNADATIQIDGDTQVAEVLREAFDHILVRPVENDFK